ncbi:hypothetical protein D9M72_629890 [compost metagenome]
MASMDTVLSPASPYGIPARSAAAATASSPSGWNSRVAPVGVSVRGRALLFPSSVVLVSGPETGPQLGMSAQESKTARLRRSVTSSSEPPSR